MTLDITLDDLTAKLGQYKRIGQEYLFQCPICMDGHKDNLHYNPKKGVLWCFADDTHSPALLSEIMKEKKAMETDTVNIPQWKLEQEAYYEYQNQCSINLLANLKALAYLEEHTCIKKNTVLNFGIGYDFDDNKWVFPVYTMDLKLVGFEYRAGDLTTKKVWKEKDTPACMALIHKGTSDIDILYICEGFKDAYILAQWMKFADNVAIVSPSNGVAIIEKCITEIEFNSFGEIRLCLDNDRAGLTATDKLIAKYPILIDKTPHPNDGKDLTDLYIEMVVKNEHNKS